MLYAGPRRPVLARRGLLGLLFRALGDLGLSGLPQLLLRPLSLSARGSSASAAQA